MYLSSFVYIRTFVRTTVHAAIDDEYMNRDRANNITGNNDSGTHTRPRPRKQVR